jgi:hypothetical protein
MRLVVTGFSDFGEPGTVWKANPTSSLAHGLATGLQPAADSKHSEPPASGAQWGTAGSCDVLCCDVLPVAAADVDAWVASTLAPALQDIQETVRICPAQCPSFIWHAEPLSRPARVYLMEGFLAEGSDACSDSASLAVWHNHCARAIH